MVMRAKVVLLSPTATPRRCFRRSSGPSRALTRYSRARPEPRAGEPARTLEVRKCTSEGFSQHRTHPQGEEWSFLAKAEATDRDQASSFELSNINRKGDSGRRSVAANYKAKHRLNTLRGRPISLAEGGSRTRSARGPALMDLRCRPGSQGAGSCPIMGGNASSAAQTSLAVHLARQSVPTFARRNGNFGAMKRTRKDCRPTA